MKNNFKNKVISFTVLLSMLFSTLITASVAWIVGFFAVESDGNFTAAQIVSYFAKGDGTEGDPFIISEAEHLYNLAWLQNNGHFDKAMYFQISDLNGNKTTIDMAGEISGTDTKSGAIPPIGTEEHPFIGHFNGNGSIISNLWVSTDKNDWKEQPDSITTDFSAEGMHYVGLFGKIANNAIIYNFILDKIEVKTHVNSTLGIICGYVDAMIFDVGVYNGIVTIANGATFKSNYTLLGDKSSRIIWEDMPEISPDYGGGGSNGGVIRVDVNDGKLQELFVNKGNVKNWNDKDPLDGAYRDIYDALPTEAVKKRSFLVGDVSISLLSGTNAFHFYSTPIPSRTGYDSNGQKTIQSTTKTSLASFNKQDNTYVTITAADYTGDYATDGANKLLAQGIKYNDDFYKRISAYSGKPLALKTGTAPSATSLTTIQLDPDDPKSTLMIPSNGIWFKPMASGPCVISFAIVNKSGSATRSIYRYKRKADGKTIDPDSWTETKLSFTKNVFGNSDLVAYQFDIDSLDVIDGYEFVIGASTGQRGDNDNLGFVFLALAGASATGGDNDGGPPVFKEAMYDVDYVTGTDVDVTGTYKIHQTMLRITEYNNLSGSDRKFYYLAHGNPSKVYYKEPDEIIIDISVEKMSKKWESTDTEVNIEDRYEVP